MKIPIKNKAVALVALFLSFVLCFFTAAAHAEDALISDDSLRDALTALLEGAEPTIENLAELEGEIDLSGKAIADISGLEHLTAVTALNLSDNRIENIDALENLSALILLDITKNHIDITQDSDAMAVITALETKDAPCTVEYQPQKVRVGGIEMQESLILCPGDTAALTVTFTPSEADDDTLFWQSSNEDVAAVENGTVTARSVGESVITAVSRDGGHTAECSVTVHDTITSQVYTIENERIMGVSKNTASDTFLENLEADNAHLALKTAAGSAVSSGVVATNMQVSLTVNDTLRGDPLTVIVRGDVTGDGNITISDYTLTRLDILELKPITGCYRYAADVNDDDNITISDYTMLRLDILGLKPLDNSLPELPHIEDARIRKYIDIAISQIGKPYISGEEGPDSFDCSGLLHYCLNQAGYKIGRCTAHTYSKHSAWLRVKMDELQPGDAIFFWSDTRPGIIGHVGFYLGNNYFIHASSSFEGVVISRLEGYYNEHFSHGRRIYK